MNGELILLLGGARAGKSAAAERLAQAGRRVLFIATAEALDEEMVRRIAAHRARRPSAWDTLEEPLDPGAAASPILDRYDTVVLDCLTLWVSNLLLRQVDDSVAEAAILEATGALLELIERSAATWIVISNEVGPRRGAAVAAGAHLPRRPRPRESTRCRTRQPGIPHGGRARPGAEGTERAPVLSNRTLTRRTGQATATWGRRAAPNRASRSSAAPRASATSSSAASTTASYCSADAEPAATRSSQARR